MATEPPEIAPDDEGDTGAPSHRALRGLAKQAERLEKITAESVASLATFEASSLLWVSERLTKIAMDELGMQDPTMRNDVVATLIILLGSANTHAMVTAGMRALRLRDRSAPECMQLAARAELAQRSDASEVLVLGNPSAAILERERD